MKVKMKSALGVGAVVASSLLVLSGCSSDNGAESPSPEPTQATDLCAPDANAEPVDGKLTIWVDVERVEAIKPATECYTKSRGVEVEVVGKSNDDIRADFIQQSPQGTGPDIVMGAHDWVGELTKAAVIAPIELGDTKAGFSETAIKASTWDGQIYMLPYAVENIAVIRNADIIPEAATSYDDMIKKGQDAGLEKPFVVQQGTAGDPYHLYPFQTAFDAPVFGSTEDGAYNPADLKMGSEGGFKFAEWLGKQGAAGHINTDLSGDIALEQFQKGEAAFWLTGPWNVNNATNGGAINVAIDLIPSPTDKVAAPFAGVKGFYLNANESANRLAATDFLVNYLGSEQVQTELYEAGNVLPALTAAADKAAASSEIIAGFQKVGAEAQPMPALPEMAAVWDFWGVAEAEILNGGNPKDVWTKLIADINSALGN